MHASINTFCKNAIAGIAIIVVFLAWTAICVGSEARNVVLFIADDMSLDAGCYGNSVVKTPNLDRLASEGVLFTHAFCTASSCSPSRAVIMTGLHTHANGQLGLAHAVHNFSSRDNVISLPILMKKAGYRTARIGRAVHVRPEKLYHFDLTLPDPDSPLTLAKRLYGRDVIRRVADAKEFIEAENDRPFFLMFCTSDAHRFVSQFEQKAGHPNTFANDYEYEQVNETHYSPDEVLVPPFLNDDLQTRAELAEYYQAVSRIDQGLGAMMRMLQETNHWDDTLLMFISDHGMPFPGAKATVYEPGLRCPCVVHLPGDLKKQVDYQGITADAMVSWVDVTPTILDYARATPEGIHFHGRSFLAVLRGDSDEKWDEVYASHTFHEVTMYYPMRVVRTRRYKLIWNIASPLAFPMATDLWDSATWQAVIREKSSRRLGKRKLEAFLHRPEFELYDLEADPDEVHNLAYDSQYSQQFAELKDKLKRFQIATDDPWKIKWERE